MDGLYYSAGFNQSPGLLDSFYGSYNARGGTIWEHQRFLATSSPIPKNYTGSGSFPADAVIDYTDTASDVEYVMGVDGAFRIGIGQSPFLSLRVAVRAPKFGGEAPYIDPAGVLNSASFAPFTTGVAKGELLTIFGNGLASKLVVAPGTPFPNSLGGVQVLMNNRPAAIYYVSPSQISAIVPYGITDAIVQIQIIKDGAPSNTVTAFMYTTNPGIFSLPQNGQGLGAVLHANYQLVSEANPATPGEAILVYLTGLGEVAPTIADGDPGPTRTLAEAIAQISARVDNLQANVGYSGLAPTLSGLYQVNLSVPDAISVTGGADTLCPGGIRHCVYLDIAGPDSYTTLVKIPVAALGAAASDSVSMRKAVENKHRR
ncbi:MAG: IPT/TIG domain-containing protein, partial [Acidobacteriota bacterium]